jgi:hypothetical protein
MSYKSKYVIIDTDLFAAPVVFSDLLQHADVVRSLAGKTSSAISAGFCYIKVVDGEPRYVCYGESISLGLKSRPEEDARILNKYLGVVHDESF